MSPSVHRGAGVLALAGSGAGIAAALPQVLVEGLPWGTRIVLLFFIAASLVGLVAGTLTLEGSVRSGATMMIGYWLLQIPVVLSETLSYQFSAGAHLTVIVVPALSVTWGVGTTFNLSGGKTGAFAFGFNVIATALFITFVRVRARARMKEEASAA
jgi:hypothetical protein